MLDLSLRGQLVQILRARFVRSASPLCVQGHMDELWDNGALVMLGSTKRPRKAQTGLSHHAYVHVCEGERDYFLQLHFKRFLNYYYFCMKTQLLFF